MKECPNCGKVNGTFAVACVTCGYIFDMDVSDKQKPDFLKVLKGIKLKKYAFYFTCACISLYIYSVFSIVAGFVIFFALPFLLLGNTVLSGIAGFNIIAAYCWETEAQDVRKPHVWQAYVLFFFNVAFLIYRSYALITSTGFAVIFGQ